MDTMHYYSYPAEKDDRPVLVGQWEYAYFDQTDYTQEISRVQYRHAGEERSLNTSLLRIFVELVADDFHDQNIVILIKKHTIMKIVDQMESIPSEIADFLGLAQISWSGRG